MSRVIAFANQKGGVAKRERALMDVANSYDYSLIDCPPSLGILTINGLTAASEVLIPLQAEALSHRGVGQLLETIADIKRFTNPGLRVSGVIVTIFDPRTRHAREVLSDVSSRHGVEVLPRPNDVPSPAPSSAPPVSRRRGSPPSSWAC